jgi:hypothetical protein
MKNHCAHQQRKTKKPVGAPKGSEIDVRVYQGASTLFGRGRNGAGR